MLAVDVAGAPVAGLSTANVSIKGVKGVRPVLGVENASEPESVCILADASNLDRLSLVRAKAKKLIRNLAAADEVCVASFSSELILEEKFTTDHRSAIAALDRIQPEGGTQLRDGLVQLSDYMRGASQNAARSIVLFSDGSDHRSTTSKRSFAEHMALPGTPAIHFICLPAAFGNARSKQGDPREGMAFRITGATGGMNFFPHTMGDMNGRVEVLPQALRSRYVVRFSAMNPAADGHEEQLQLVSPFANRGLRLLTRESLRAPKLAPSPSTATSAARCG